MASIKVRCPNLRMMLFLKNGAFLKIKELSTNLKVYFLKLLGQATSSTSSGIGSATSSVYKISATSSASSSEMAYSSTRYTSAEMSETESTSSTLTAGSVACESAAAPDVDAIRKRLEMIKRSAY